jgi:hypothetical protein
VLGDWVDAVIIEPRFMDRAYAHFDSNYKATRTKLIQSENVSPQDQGGRQGMLAEAVITENSFARAFINVRLGRIVRARSANDIRKGDLAASADGKYAHGRGIEYRRLQQIPRLGKSVRDQQIAQLTQDQKDLQPLLDRAKESETRLHAVVEALRRAETVLVTCLLSLCPEPPSNLPAHVNDVAPGASYGRATIVANTLSDAHGVANIATTKRSAIGSPVRWIIAKNLVPWPDSNQHDVSANFESGAPIPPAPSA